MGGGVFKKTDKHFLDSNNKKKVIYVKHDSKKQYVRHKGDYVALKDYKKSLKIKGGMLGFINKKEFTQLLDKFNKLESETIPKLLKDISLNNENFLDNFKKINILTNDVKTLQDNFDILNNKFFIYNKMDDLFNKIKNKITVDYKKIDDNLYQNVDENQILLNENELKFLILKKILQNSDKPYPIGVLTIIENFLINLIEKKKDIDDKFYARIQIYLYIPKDNSKERLSPLKEFVKDVDTLLKIFNIDL